MPKKPRSPRKRPEGRFYEREWPEVSEAVVVKVVEQASAGGGAYVQLLEYNHQRALLLADEVTNRKVLCATLEKLIGIGRARAKVCLVVAVDKKEELFIDLSRRKVDPELAANKQEAFAKAKAVHGIMWHVSDSNKIPVEELCSKVSWRLHKKYGNAYDVLRRHLDEEINVWDDIDFSQPGKDLSALAPKLRVEIEAGLRRRLIKQTQQLRAKVEITYSGFEGIDAIKEALQRGLEASQADCQVEIHLISSPLFSLSCKCREKDLGVKILEQSIDLIKESIEAKGGHLRLKLPPMLVGHEDEYEPSDDDDEGGDVIGSSDPGEDRYSELSDFYSDYEIDDEEDEEEDDDKDDRGQAT